MIHMKMFIACGKATVTKNDMFVGIVHLSVPFFDKFIIHHQMPDVKKKHKSGEIGTDQAGLYLFFMI